ncbi:MAG: hypothetical protein SPI34_03180 [Opitutales bacterium]|nr:hypothetical protein [Opitutales bacterium]
MILFIDVENKKLVLSLTSDRSVPAPVFMQDDNEPLEIFLLQKGGESLYEIKPLVVGTDFLRVAIARFKGYPKSLTYATGYTLNPNGGTEIDGKKNVLKISLVPDTYNTSHEYELPTKYFSGNRMLHKIRFSIYLPTTNPNSTKVQLRLGSIAPASAGTIVSKTDNIDKSGVILPKDELPTAIYILATLLPPAKWQAKAIHIRTISRPFRTRQDSLRMRKSKS